MHRILIVGTGSIGERHVRCFLETKRASVGICEVNDSLRDEIAARYQITESFASLDEALQHSWDAGVIAAPAHVHIPIAQKLADASVNLLIEKPLSTKMEGISQLEETIRTQNLIACVAFIYRAHPVLSALRDELKSGRFGKPLQVVVVCGQHFPFYRPAYRETYYTDHAKGGGAIQDILPHYLNACEWLVGPITTLVADADRKLIEGGDVEDTVNLLCRHGEVMGSYNLNLHQAPNEVTITLVCEKGTLRFELCKSRWRWMTEPGEMWHDEIFPTMERDDWFVLQDNAFLDTLEGKMAPLCTIDEAKQTLKVTLSALTSANELDKWKNI